MTASTGRPIGPLQMRVRTPHLTAALKKTRNLPLGRTHLPGASDDAHDMPGIGQVRPRQHLRGTRAVVATRISPKRHRELGNMCECETNAERPERPYMGISGEQRTAERRHRLVDAGIRIASTRGCADVGVRTVCVEADLSHRYFYESFKCKNELLLAAYEQLQATLIETVVHAMGNLAEHCFTRLIRSVEAFLRFFEHNRHARWILLFESAIPGALNKDPTWRLLSAYEAMLTDELRRGANGNQPSNQAAQAMACGLLGATVQLTVRCLVRSPSESIDHTLAALRFIYGAAIHTWSRPGG